VEGERCIPETCAICLEPLRALELEEDGSGGGGGAAAAAANARTTVLTRRWRRGLLPGRGKRQPRVMRVAGLRVARARVWAWAWA